MGTIADKLTYLNGTKTAIKEAIVAKGVTVTDTDTFRSYAGKIGQISGGGAPETLYGATIDMVFGKEAIGNLSFDGVEIADTLEFYGRFCRAGNATFIKPECTISFPDLVEVKTNGVAYMFMGNTQTTASGEYKVNFLFPKLKTIGTSGFLNFIGGGVFSSGYVVKNLSFPLLESITGSRGLDNAFSGQNSQTALLEELNLPQLTTIDGSYACEEAFSYQNALRTVNLPRLQNIKGTSVCRNMFKDCTSLTKMSFPSLTSITNNAFGNSSSTYMFSGCTALAEIHFRADMQATIEAMSGYANKWGASSSTIYFDL